MTKTELRVKVRELRASGMAAAHIMERFGITSELTLARLLIPTRAEGQAERRAVRLAKRAQREANRRGSRVAQYNKIIADGKRITQMLADGWYVVDIARELGCSRDRAYRAIRIMQHINGTDSGIDCEYDPMLD